MSPRFVLPLSAAEILTVPAKKIADAAFASVHTYMKANTKFEIHAMLELAQPWRAVWLPRQCKADVDNGGFHQFFWNSEGKLNQAFMEDLAFLGAQNYLEVVRKAVAVFSEYDYVEEKRRAGFSWRKFTAGYRQKRLERFDDEFYELDPDLDAITGAFVKSNVQSFKTEA